MFKITKILVAMTFVVMAASTAIASQAYYGLPKHHSNNSVKAKKALDSNVVLVNHTGYTYMTYATFMPSYKTLNLPLGLPGSGTDIITYDINYPDTALCLKVYRDYDGYLVYNACQSSGTIDIWPSSAMSHQNKPIVRVTH